MREEQKHKLHRVSAFEADMLNVAFERNRVAHNKTWETSGPTYFHLDTDYRDLHRLGPDARERLVLAERTDQFVAQWDDQMYQMSVQLACVVDRLLRVAIVPFRARAERLEGPSSWWLPLTPPFVRIDS